MDISNNVYIYIFFLMVRLYVYASMIYTNTHIHFYSINDIPVDLKKSLTNKL